MGHILKRVTIIFMEAKKLYQKGKTNKDFQSSNPLAAFRLDFNFFLLTSYSGLRPSYDFSKNLFNAGKKVRTFIDWQDHESCVNQSHKNTSGLSLLLASQVDTERSGL